MKTNYLQLVEDYNKRINYTENEKNFRIDRLNENASEIALGFVLDSREYKEMKATGFKGNIAIIIGVEKVRCFILERYQLPMTDKEAIMFIGKALENTGLFKLVNIYIYDGYVKALLDFSKLNVKPEGFKEFDVIIDCEYKLNVREKPDLIAKITRKIDAGTITRVYGEIGCWYKVNGGYIRKEFTKINKPFGGIK